MDRLAGYQKALDERRITFDQSLVRYGNYDEESGYQQMKSLLESPLSFTAVFVASDTIALGAKAALRESGLNIPEDVALVGFDDLPFAQYMDPPLTTVHLPASEIARQASEMLIDLLEGGEPECKQIILDTHLVVRESCGASRMASSIRRCDNPVPRHGWATAKL